MVVRAEDRFAPRKNDGLARDDGWEGEAVPGGTVAVGTRSVPLRSGTRDAPCSGTRDAPCLGARDAPCLGTRDAPCLGARDAPCLGTRDAPCSGTRDHLRVGPRTQGRDTGEEPPIRHRESVHGLRP